MLNDSCSKGVDTEERTTRTLVRGIRHCGGLMVRVAGVRSSYAYMNEY